MNDKDLKRPVKQKSGTRTGSAAGKPMKKTASSAAGKPKKTVSSAAGKTKKTASASVAGKQKRTTTSAVKKNTGSSVRTGVKKSGPAAKKVTRDSQMILKNKNKKQGPNYKKLGIGAGAVVAALLLFIGVGGLLKKDRVPKNAMYSDAMIETELQETEISQTEVMQTETPQPETPQPETEPLFQEKEILLGATGSMLFHDAIINSGLQDDGSYDFSYIYQYVAPYYQLANFMTCEYEGSFGGAERGYRGYPNFNTPEKAIANMRDAGIDLQLLASNHLYDLGHDAMLTTMWNYSKEDAAYTGIRPDTEHRPYYRADIGGIIVGFINYAYELDYNSEGQLPETNSIRGLNGYNLLQEDFPLVNTFDINYLGEFYEELQQRIWEMRSEGCQFIVVNMHWGDEYQLQENQIQRDMAQQIVDLGADAIIGGHPHCEQPVDVLTSSDGMRQVPVVYSVGNTLSNQRAAYMKSLPTGETEDGVIVYLRLHQNTDGNVYLNGVDYIPTWVYLSGSGHYYILPLNDINSMVANTGFDVAYSAQASRDRTVAVMGAGFEKAKQTFGSIF